VQDNNAYVQKLINRIQPLQNLIQATHLAKNIGYTSVNYDLIYGLPGQTLSSLQQTIEECIALQPNRIAFYSYAHVPWTSKAQRLFDEKDLPSSSEKLKLYHLGKTLFTQKGYKDIGMDHFALPDDELFIASQNGKLHRNFMGYTTQQTHILIGLGVSSISDIGNAYAQNHKTIQQYYQSLSVLKLPVLKGYFLSNEDENMKQHILQLICKGFTHLPLKHKEAFEQLILPKLNELEKDQLIQWHEQTITVTETGKNFIRNICKAFDLHLLRKEKQLSQQQPLFSNAV
jgi:oxygen-independent coproporphyrinogen-3 oxidase